jgi:hypothetical protein
MRKKPPTPASKKKNTPRAGHTLTRKAIAYASANAVSDQAAYAGHAAELGTLTARRPITGQTD